MVERVSTCLKQEKIKVDISKMTEDRVFNCKGNDVYKVIWYLNTMSGEVVIYFVFRLCEFGLQYRVIFYVLTQMKLLWNYDGV